VTAISFHLLALFSFLGATSVYLIATVVCRLRVRRVVAWWLTGPVAGLPAWPVLFLCVVGTLLAYSTAAGHYLAPVMLGGYVAGGLCWLAGAALASSAVASQYGIVPRAGQPRSAITWAQVVDYAARERPGGGAHYTFFYLDAHAQRQQLALEVPAARADAFASLVEAKLDARFAFPAQQAHGTSAWRRS
jgi:hypothetical protein